MPDWVSKERVKLIEGYGASVILVSKEEGGFLKCLEMSKQLAKELGLGVGISSGANFIGGILANRKYNGPIATVFADDNKKYLSTDLSKPIDENNLFISNNIKLKNYEVC